MAADSAEDDDPEHALREVRGRFIAAFPGQCDSVALLLAGAATDRARQDGVPRHLTGDQRRALRSLAAQAMSQLELRRQLNAVHDQRAHLISTINAVPTALIIRDSSGQVVLQNHAADRPSRHALREVHAAAPGEHQPGEGDGAAASPARPSRSASEATERPSPRSIRHLDRTADGAQPARIGEFFANARVRLLMSCESAARGQRDALTQAGAGIAVSRRK